MSPTGGLRCMKFTTSSVRRTHPTLYGMPRSPIHPLQLSAIDLDIAGLVPEAGGSSQYMSSSLSAEKVSRAQQK